MDKDMQKVLAADNYLGKIARQKKEIMNKRMELEALMYRASGAGAIQYDKEKVMTSSMGGAMEMLMGDIMELEQKIQELEEELGAYIIKVRNVTKLMEYAEGRTLIEWFYINGESMRNCAKKMYRSERKIYDVKRKTLIEFYDILKRS